MNKQLWLLLFCSALLIGCNADLGGGPGAATAELSREINIYSWADYIPTELIDAYEQANDVTINYDNYASNEELLAKLQAGVTGYDLVFPSDYMVRIMLDLDLLAEIDVNDLANFGNVADTFTNPPYDPGNSHCVPYQWGTTGIAYRTDHPFFAQNPPDSWGYLFEPELLAQYEEAGINMLGDQREVIGAALIYLGYDYNDTVPAHLNEALALLLRAKPYWKTISSHNYDDSLLVPGEVALSHAWSGDAAAAYWKTIDEETGQSPWAYAIPKEGAARWVDNVCIPATSQNKEGALRFIDYLLQAENGAEITNFTYFATPNEAATPFILEEIKNDPGIYPPQAVMDKLVLTEVNDEAVALYNEIWTVVR